MAHLWLQNANEAEARKCERLNRSQLAPASRVDAQIAIHVESGTTCRSSACFGPAKRPRNKGRRAIRGMRCVARSGGTSAGRQMAVILGRAAGVPPVRRGALRWTDSVCCRAQGRLLSGGPWTAPVPDLNLNSRDPALSAMCWFARLPRYRRASAELHRLVSPFPINWSTWDGQSAVRAETRRTNRGM